MSWNRIVVPLQLDNADTVAVGNMAWDCYRRANQPEGFAMFHATEGDQSGDGDLDTRMIIYLSPVASEVCREISDKYPFEPCNAPARNEPNMAYVFGDPRMMGQLRDSVDTDRLVST